MIRDTGDESVGVRDPKGLSLSTSPGLGTEVLCVPGRGSNDSRPTSVILGLDM